MTLSVIRRTPDYRRVKPHKNLFRACALLQLLMVSAVADPPPPDVSISVRQAVLGIISYTRWPRKLAAQRLCVVGQPSHAGALSDGPTQIGGIPLIVSRSTLPADHIGNECDTVYTGALTETETLSLHRQLAGHPVLTITETDPSCSGTSMFCLDTTGEGGHVFFAVNLDSVARSGVLVNPRVLLLGRRKKTQP
jgi:hypothetical protein